MAKLFEFKGYKTLVFMPTWISSVAKYFDRTIQTGKVMLERAGCLARARAMQRFDSLLTSAELEPTPL